MKPFNKSTITIKADGTRLKTIAARISEEMASALAKEANKEHRSISAQIVHYIELGINGPEKRK